MGGGRHTWPPTDLFEAPLSLIYMYVKKIIMERATHPTIHFLVPYNKKRCFTVHLNLLMSVYLLNVLFLLTCSEPLSYRKKSGHFRQEGSETTHHRQYLVFPVHGGRGSG